MAITEQQNHRCGRADKAGDSVGTTGPHLTPLVHKSAGGKDQQQNFYGYLSPHFAFRLNSWMLQASVMGLPCNEDLTSQKGTTRREFQGADLGGLDSTLERGVRGRQVRYDSGLWLRWLEAGRYGVRGLRKLNLEPCWVWGLSKKDWIRY